MLFRSLPIPEDITLILCGYATYLHEGNQSPHAWTMACASVGVGLAGVLIGDGTMFWLGRRWGTDLAKVWPFRSIFGNGRLERTRVFLQEHGAKVLFTARFTPGIEGPACDRDGAVYAVNLGREGTIGRVSPDGTAAEFLALPGTSVGNGIRFDKRGRMFVADYALHNVLLIDPRTRKVKVFAHNAEMNQPNDLTMARDGTLYLSQGAYIPIIRKIDPDGIINPGALGLTR